MSCYDTWVQAIETDSDELEQKREKGAGAGREDMG